MAADVGWFRTGSFSRAHYRESTGYSLCGRYLGYGASTRLILAESQCGNCTRILATKKDLAEIAAEALIPENPLVEVAESTQSVDMVNHPPHYNQHPKGIECIDVIEDNPFLNLGNAMRYLWRVSWGGKWDSKEDLKKAVWFIEREISRREKRGIE
jgi:hypothetical protein